MGVADAGGGPGVAVGGCGSSGIVSSFRRVRPVRLGNSVSDQPALAVLKRAFERLDLGERHGRAPLDGFVHGVDPVEKAADRVQFGFDGRQPAVDRVESVL